MASIRSADVARLRDEWLKTYAPATVLRRLALLSHVFNVSRKEWGMESLLNPIEAIRKPQPKTQEPDVLRAFSQNRLLKKYSDARKTDQYRN